MMATAAALSRLRITSWLGAMLRQALDPFDKSLPFCFPRFDLA
jgi:hypothetical protein